MRKFTALFLLALAMTIGADQTFAQQNTDSNDIGKIDRPDRPDPPEHNDDDDDGDDPLTPINPLARDHRCDNFAAAVIDCAPPPRRRKKTRVVVQKEPEDCGCEHKVVRVGARFVTVVDCYYQAISVNGREQLRYCTKDD